MVGFLKSGVRALDGRLRICLVAAALAVLGAAALSLGAVSARASEGFSIGVISDPHFFPAEYQGARAEAYQEQISGDLRLMGENEALTTSAVDQMIADDKSGSRPLPKVLLVTGDLSSEGEEESHRGFAEQMKRLQDAGVTVLVIPGNHDLYNGGAMTFQEGGARSALRNRLGWRARVTPIPPMGRLFKRSQAPALQRSHTLSGKRRWPSNGEKN